jgi:hypothetical protein
VGQRATDVLTVLSFIHINSNMKELPIEINTSGVAAISVLHALLFDKQTEKIYVKNSIHSFKEILESPLEKNRFGYIIPGVLRYYDIPDLIKMIGWQRVEYL